MVKNQHKGVGANNSKFTPTAKETQLMSALKNIMQGDGGTVSYMFTETKTVTVVSTVKGEQVESTVEMTYVKSMTHSDVNSKIFKKDERGVGRNLLELVQMFDDIRHDLGADYFEIH